MIQGNKKVGTGITKGGITKWREFKIIPAGQ